MIVLISLIVVWFIYSIYRINKKSENDKFDPFNGNPFEFIGFLFGSCFFIIVFIEVIIKYLP